MKYRGSLFNGEMVRAILEGRKTQTRRVVKGHTLKCLQFDALKDPIKNCPFGKIGDRLYVRETFKYHSFGSSYPMVWPKRDIKPPNRHYIGIKYRSDGDVRKIECDESGHEKYASKMAQDEFDAWRPSIHMPKWASRITLEILNVRVERLQDISNEGAMLEGVQPSCGAVIADYRGPFIRTWKEIYPGSWEKNPWVWVVEFKKLEVKP